MDATLARTAPATRSSSPFVETARGAFDIRFAEAASLRARRRRPQEDRRLKIKVHPEASRSATRR
jgi:hypothetical protein